MNDHRRHLVAVLKGDEHTTVIVDDGKMEMPAKSDACDLLALHFFKNAHLSCSAGMPWWGVRASVSEKPIP